MDKENLRSELVAYGHKMLERGDSWRSVRNYLNSKTDDDDLISEVISLLNSLEKEGHVVTPKEETSNKRNLILGFVIMGIGVFLFSFLWHSGWFAVLPIVIFGIGLRVLNGL